MAAEPRAFLPLTERNEWTRLFETLRSVRHVQAAANEPLAIALDRVAVLQRGAVVVRFRAREGAEFVEVCGVGDLLGEGAMLATAGWAATEVRALVPSRSISLSAAELWDVAGIRPGLSRWLVLALARNAERRARRIALLRTFGVRGRVRGVLTDLAERFGRPTSDGVAVALPLTQELIASLGGATRESVNRALSDLRTRGHVQRIGGVYVFRPPPSVPRANAVVPSVRSDLVTAPSASSFSR